MILVERVVTRKGADGGVAILVERLTAAGVVAHTENGSSATTPAAVAATPPHEEGNTPVPLQSNTHSSLSSITVQHTTPSPPPSPTSITFSGRECGTQRSGHEI